MAAGASRRNQTIHDGSPRHRLLSPGAQIAQAHRVALDDGDKARAETLGLLDRKRLELTRALATDPVVLLLDEIGGGLTDGEAAELVETIQVLHRRGIAIVWIEHIVHVLVQVANRLVCMDAGRVIADGDPQEVLVDATVVDAYLGGGR